jgi:hypothetical protein
MGQALNNGACAQPMHVTRLSLLLQETLGHGRVAVQVMADLMRLNLCRHQGHGRKRIGLGAQGLHADQITRPCQLHQNLAILALALQFEYALRHTPHGT